MLEENDKNDGEEEVIFGNTDFNFHSSVFLLAQTFITLALRTFVVTSSSLATKHLPEIYQNFEAPHKMKMVDLAGRYLKSYRKTIKQQKGDSHGCFPIETKTLGGNSKELESDDSSGKKPSEMPKSPSYVRKPRNGSVCFILSCMQYHVSQRTVML